MSPYLFLLVMEAFSALLKDNTTNSGFHYHDRCERMQISHVCFADDLFILSRADVASVGVIKRTLEEFGELSGLCPNPQKSSLFIAGTDARVAADISSLMQMDVKHLPVRYLGVPLIFGRLRQVDCEELKAKILKKVQHWHTKALSYAGRIQLIIAVLISIQRYWSRIFILPKQVIKDIDSILRKFFWSGPDLAKKTGHVAWVDVCMPKKEGGLGIPNIHVCNKANMA